MKGIRGSRSDYEAVSAEVAEPIVVSKVPSSKPR